METRANYALIGLFTLAVIASAFGFVLWFSGAEKPGGGRNPYKVVFPGSVSGLSVGGWVLFNGVRVGEVTKIDIMPQDPSRVYAMIAINSDTPVRSDTKARLEYTGLTGPPIEPRGARDHLCRALGLPGSRCHCAPSGGAGRRLFYKGQ